MTNASTAETNPATMATSVRSRSDCVGIALSRRAGMPLGMVDASTATWCRRAGASLGDDSRHEQRHLGFDTGENCVER